MVKTAKKATPAARRSETKNTEKTAKSNAPSYTVELSKIAKKVSSEKRIENIDLKLHSGDIFAIFANEPEVESALAKMIAGVLYTDKGVITVSENLNPKSDFFYIDSDSNLPKGISPKSFRDDLDFEPLTYFDAVVKENDGSSKYKLIVFDNPTAGKSLIDKAAFWNDIKAFVKKNKNLIVAIVSSDFDEIDSLINRVVILKDNGEIVDQKAANFKKQKSLKERVINEITN